MQGGREATCMVIQEDDMAEGDLGDGTGHSRTGPTAARKKSQSASSGHAEVLLPGMGLLKWASRGGDAAFAYSGLYTPFNQEPKGEQNVRGWRLRRTESLGDLSKEELRERLQEATEEAELLRCELEVAHRYLEGKFEALKILQGQAIYSKATSHTKSLLQKSEERTKALEKEVNSLQWEITFNQVRLKNFEQAWEQKYESLCSDNKALSDSLDERVRELQELRVENAALSQQCLELLAMLSVREQRAFQATKPPCSQGREGTVLEMAVLGACQCFSAREPCPCARSAAASRKHLLQLRQELDAQRRRREEALMVADAFRIAFEQQLRRRSDHFLFLAEADRLKSRPRKSEGGDRRSSASVAQRLKGMLPSSSEVKMSDDPTETLHRLLDLLNDKEEALAHQRKVSLMLARSAEELERRLQIDSKLQYQETSNSKLRLKDSLSAFKPQPSESILEFHPNESGPPSKLQTKESVSTFKLQPKESVSTSRLQPKESVLASKLQLKESVSTSRIQPKESVLASKLQPKESVSAPKLQPKESVSDSKLQPKNSTFDSKLQPKDSTTDSKLQPKDSTSDSKLQSKDSISDSKLQPKDSTSDSKLQSKDTTSDSKLQPQQPALNSAMYIREEKHQCHFTPSDS